MRKSTAAVIAAVCALSLAPAALAHTQTVAPPGQDEPVILNDPIARPWVQGHCHAQAPSVSGEASGGVASFSPAGAQPGRSGDGSVRATEGLRVVETEEGRASGLPR